MYLQPANGIRLNLLANIILLTLCAQTGTANLPYAAIDEPLNLRYIMSMKSIPKKFKSTNQFPVIVHAAEEGGYWVECVAFEGCYSQGETIDEALHNIQEAIQLCSEEYSHTKLRHLASQSVSLHLVTA